MKTILVFGLPGSGKTTFAKKLKALFGDDAMHFNADEVRKQANDWDFSLEGRLRQVGRMRSSAEMAHAMGKHAILDFVCPKQEYRDMIGADVEVFMNNAPVRDFADTTALFEKPNIGLLPGWDVNSYEEVNRVLNEVYLYVRNEMFEPSAPTALMIGRFQPFHAGHKALFLKALEKHGQVCIAVREMPRSESNPFNVVDVVSRIDQELEEYRGKYTVMIFPNIVDVVYGRDVGWAVSKIDLPPEIEAISATKIRAGL